MHMPLPPEAGATLISGEASCAKTDPALLVQGALAKKSRINQILTIERPAWWDNRATVADNAGLLALRLCWCFKPWHTVEVRPAPEEGARAATAGACTALLSPPRLPGP